MAALTTPSGNSVYSEDTWLSIELNKKGDEFFCFLGLFPGRPELGRHWWGQERRFDEQGRAWRRSIDRAVVDDFGTLVEVPA